MRKHSFPVARRRAIAGVSLALVFTACDRAATPVAETASSVRAAAGISGFKDGRREMSVRPRTGLRRSDGLPGSNERAGKERCARRGAQLRQRIPAPVGRYLRRDARASRRGLARGASRRRGAHPRAPERGAVRRIRRQHRGSQRQGRTAIGHTRSPRPHGAVRRAARRPWHAGQGGNRDRERAGRGRGIRRHGRSRRQCAAHGSSPHRDARHAHRQALGRVDGRTGAPSRARGDRALRCAAALPREARVSQLARTSRCTRSRSRSSIARAPVRSSKHSAWHGSARSASSRGALRRSG